MTSFSSPPRAWVKGSKTWISNSLLNLNNIKKIHHLLWVKILFCALMIGLLLYRDFICVHSLRNLISHFAIHSERTFIELNENKHRNNYTYNIYFFLNFCNSSIYNDRSKDKLVLGELKIYTYFTTIFHKNKF